MIIKCTCKKIRLKALLPITDINKEVIETTFIQCLQFVWENCYVLLMYLQIWWRKDVVGDTQK